MRGRLQLCRAVIGTLPDGAGGSPGPLCSVWRVEALQSDACSPEGYQFALDAFLLLRIYVYLVIQHNCDAGEPANGEGGIFEIGGKFLVAMCRLRIIPEPLRKGEKPCRRHFGRVPTWMRHCADRNGRSCYRGHAQPAPPCSRLPAGSPGPLELMPAGRGVLSFPC
jgi:hypothetical protein